MEKPTSAVSSLVKLRSYYQSQYEHYLAKATASKENKERVSLLLQDLAGSEIVSEAFWEEDYEPETEHFQQVREKAEMVLDSASSTGEEEDFEDNVETVNDTDRVIEALKASHQALEIIGSVSESETGKTLHLNYFQKLLEQEMSRSIDLEIVKLYLDEAISRGYLERDRFDPNCYRAVSSAPKSKKEEEVEGGELENSSSTRSYAYKLPPSSKLKATLLETIRHYMESETPRRFSILNVINYLYSTAEQQSWSRQTKNQVGSCISNVLSRKAYLNKQWKRIKPGMYQPIRQK